MKQIMHWVVYFNYNYDTYLDHFFDEGISSG